MDSWTLRLAVFSVCVIFLSLGVSHLWAVYAGTRGWISMVLAVVFIGNGVLLWTLTAWARKVSMLIMGLIVVIAPLGLASPSAYLEVWRYYTGNFPLWLVALAIIFAVVVPISWCMYVLDKYRETFR